MKISVKIALALLACFVICGIEIVVTGRYDGGFMGYITGTVVGFAIGTYNKGVRK